MPALKQQSISLAIANWVILWQVFLPAAVSAQNSQYESKAISAYNKRDFSSAVRYFSAAVVQEPQDQLLRYYLANSLALSRQYAKALPQYQAAYNLNPSGLIARYCLAAISAYTSGANAPAATAPTSNLQNFTSQAQLNRAKMQIIQEGQDIAEKRYRRGMDGAKSRVNLGNRQAQTIHDNSEAEIAALRSARIPTGGGGSAPAFSSDDIEAVRQKYELQEQQARDAAEYGNVMRQRSALAHRMSIEDSASGLASQYNANSRGFSLNPVGTSLYVRNFAYSPSSLDKPGSNPEEMLATPEKLILDSHFRPGKSMGRILPEPFSAKAGVLPGGSQSGQSNNADLKVHGELLKER